jgi:hypothetical protein
LSSIIVPGLKTLKAAEALENSFGVDGRVADVINFDFQAIFTTIHDNQ